MHNGPPLETLLEHASQGWSANVARRQPLWNSKQPGHTLSQIKSSSSVLVAYSGAAYWHPC